MPHTYEYETESILKIRCICRVVTFFKVQSL